MSKKAVTYLILFAILAVTLLAGGASGKEKALPKIVTIAAFPMGSSAMVHVIAMGEAIQPILGIKVKPTPSDTDMGRAMAVRVKEAEAFVGGSPTLWILLHGAEEFKSPDWGPQKIRVFWAGYRTTHAIAVKANSGIKTWDDLRGKKVAVATGMHSKFLVPAHLAFGGLTMNDVVRVQSPGNIACIKMTMDGAADFCVAYPSTFLVKEWEAAPYGLRFLHMPPEDKEGWQRVKAVAPYLTPIFRGEGEGALGVSGPGWFSAGVYTISTYDFVDEYLIYSLVKALDEAYDQYKDVQPPFSREWGLKSTADLEWIKLIDGVYHPGFIKYAKEKGLWTSEHEKYQASVLKLEEERIANFKAKK